MKIGSKAYFKVFLPALFLVFLFSVGSFVYGFATNSPEKPAIIGIDFEAYYTAGRMVIEGDISEIYDISAHHARLEKLLDQDIPFLLAWLYPPTFLLAVVPLAYLPHDLAIYLWLGVTLILAAFAAYLLSKRNKLYTLYLLGYSGIYMNFHWAQNGFLNTALIGFGLYFVEANPILAGLMFGLLTYKPQIAIFPFIILLILKKWRALMWSCIFASILAIVSGLIFGFGVWIDFIASSFTNADALSSVWEGVAWGQPTLYTALRSMGINGLLLSLMLIVVAACAIFACVWVWKNTDRITLRGSALVLGIFISIPYLSLYDTAMLSIPFLLLSMDCFEYGFRRVELASLLLLFLLPILCFLIFTSTNVQICPFGLMIVFMIVMRRVKRYDEV